MAYWCLEPRTRPTSRSVGDRPLLWPGRCVADVRATTQGVVLVDPALLCLKTPTVRHDPWLRCGTWSPCRVTDGNSPCRASVRPSKLI